jgi:hypothetical protein
MQRRPGKLSGPLEETPFPEQLLGRVVTPGAAPRLHGYDVERDIAVHYGQAELVLLALTGELPDSRALVLFEVACAFLSPISVAHAPAHAAVLSRLCGTTTSATIGTAAIALGEEARALLDDHADLLSWLAQPSESLPERHRARDADDGAAVVRLIETLARRGVSVPELALGPTRSAALVMVLHASGLTTRERQEAAVAMARFPVALAEAFAERVANFKAYPIDLPHFEYQESS